MNVPFETLDFVTIETARFAPAFEGAQSKRDTFVPSVFTRRSLRRSRRENRAL